MGKILLPLMAALVLASCVIGPVRRVPSPQGRPDVVGQPQPSIIMDHKNNQEPLPYWVVKWLEGGAREVETLEFYEDRFVFISRNEGSNFNALTNWAEGFLPDLDFPRLAAARIQARFSSGVPHPDYEYGAFFVTLVRTASDAQWTGAIKEDDFWIRRKYLPAPEETFDEDDNPDASLQEREAWEFLILVTIEKELFASQLEEVFENIRPSPQPTKDQTAAISRVKERVFEGF